MDLPNKFLSETAFITGSKVEEHMLIVMNESTHEGNLSIPLKTNNKPLKIAVPFLTVYIGTFNITNKNNKFFFYSIS